MAKISMAVELFIPEYGKTKKTLQDIIMIILAKEFPLTTGEIAKRAKGNFKVGVTFQAIRKSLRALVEKKVLIEKDKAFLVNKEYILELRRLSDQFLRNYFTAERKNKLPTWSSVGEGHTSYVFDNLLQADKFWGEVVLDWARNLKEDEDRRFCFHGPHCWYPLGHLGTESDFLLELKENKVKSYYLVEGNTPLDVWTKEFYIEHKVNYSINKPWRELKAAIGVFGEFIIQFDYPGTTYRKIEEFYKKSSSLSGMNMAAIARLLKGNIEIKLVVINNQTIALKLKEDIFSFFRKR